LEDFGGAASIGVFVGASDAAAVRAPGAAWLSSPNPPVVAPPREAVAAVVRACRAARPARGPAASALPLLPPLPPPSFAIVLGADARRALVAQVDAAWAAARARAGAVAGGAAFVPAPSSSPSPLPAAAGPPETLLAASIRRGSSDADFRLLLSRGELAAAVGAAALRKLERALGGDLAPDAIAVRRTQAMGRWISFHCDANARTLQVPLSDDGDCVGGRLLFAREASGVLEAVPRRAGVALAHDGGEPHGVTALMSGTRYGLFLSVA
jgi:hypothetical protein